MVSSYRRYKKRFYKRYGSRKRRTTFSRYSTYRYRSSKAQANQIYRLNRRINKIEKSTKPEILTYDTNNYKTIFSYSDSTPGKWTSLPKFFATDTVFNNAKVLNKSCRIRKVIFYGTLSRDTNFDEFDLERDPSSYLRMLVLQHRDNSKIEENNTTLTDQYFIQDNGILDYDAPLVSGASTHDRILKYKKFKITSFNPNIINFKFSVYPYYNVYTKTDNINTGDGKGSIYCVMSGYHFGSQNSLVNSETVLLLRARIIYYDA